MADVRFLLPPQANGEHKIEEDSISFDPIEDIDSPSDSNADERLRVDLEWENLAFSVKQKKQEKTILNGVSGEVKAGMCLSQVYSFVFGSCACARTHLVSACFSFAVLASASHAAVFAKEQRLCALVVWFPGSLTVSTNLLSTIPSLRPNACDHGCLWRGQDVAPQPPGRSPDVLQELQQYRQGPGQRQEEVCCACAGLCMFECRLCASPLDCSLLGLTARKPGKKARVLGVWVLAYV